MVKKLAVFVEGSTEQVFVKKLIEEIAGKHEVNFKVISNRGRNVSVLLDEGEDANYYVMLVHCNNDERVKSVILDQRESLINSNYEMVVGLLDLYPFSITEIENVKRGLKTRVPTKDITIDIFLSVMEVEAWFLQDENHYSHIHEELSVELVKNRFGFDPLTDCAENIDKPADFLNSIYQEVGLAYRKKHNQITRTVECLDYENFYLEIHKRLPHFNDFMWKIDNFFA